MSSLLQYSRLPITRTFKGNPKKVRVVGSLSYREFEENSCEYGKKQFLLYSEHFNHILIVEMSSENYKILLDYETEGNVTKYSLNRACVLLF